MLAAGKGRRERCSAVFDACKKETASEMSQTALRLLLEDPSMLLAGVKASEVEYEWEHSEVPWRTVPESCGKHSFVTERRRCSFGRLCDFRVHRFVLPGEAAVAMNEELRQFPASARRVLI